MRECGRSFVWGQVQERWGGGKRDLMGIGIYQEENDDGERMMIGLILSCVELVSIEVQLYRQIGRAHV